MTNTELHISTYRTSLRSNLTDLDGNNLCLSLTTRDDRMDRVAIFVSKDEALDLASTLRKAAQELEEKGSRYELVA